MHADERNGNLQATVFVVSFSAFSASSVVHVFSFFLSADYADFHRLKKPQPKTFFYRRGRRGHGVKEEESLFLIDVFSTSFPVVPAFPVVSSVFGFSYNPSNQWNPWLSIPFLSSCPFDKLRTSFVVKARFFARGSEWQKKNHLRNLRINVFVTSFPVCPVSPWLNFRSKVLKNENKGPACIIHVHPRASVVHIFLFFLVLSFASFASLRFKYFLF